MLIMPPQIESIQDYIERFARSVPDAVCCSIRTDRGIWIDYSRRIFWEHVCHYAKMFTILPPQTLILFVKKLDIHLLSAYIGAIKAGHLPAQISVPSSKVNETEYRKKVAHIYEITRFGAVFCDTEVHELYEHFGNALVFNPDTPVSKALILKSEGAIYRDALVQFSSGSTGFQKGVVLTHAGIGAHMRSYSSTLQLNDRDTIVSWLPLYHDMGLIACFLLPLMCGIPFLQMDPFDWIMRPDLLLQVIEERRPTICYLPNFAYQVLVNKCPVRDISSIRLWINCSEPARLRNHNNFLLKFPSVRPESLTVCYALAENTFAVSQSLPWHNNANRQHELINIMSCGKPLPNVEVRIFKEGNESDGEVGIKSPFLFARFLDGSLPLREGYYLTGDLGFIDSNGELFITGRKKDLIIVHGKNIYPQDVESVVSEIDGVYPGRVAAFGCWDDEIGTEELYVIIERKSGAAPIPIKIAAQKAVNEEIGIVPKRVEIVEHMSLVKTSSGKISRSRNKEIYLSKGLELL